MKWRKSYTQTCVLPDFTPEKEWEEKNTGLQLQNSFIALVGWGKKTKAVPEPAKPEMQVSIKGKQPTVIIGGSFPRGMQAPICQPCLLSKENCCLPEAQIPDDMKWFTRFVQPLDYFCCCSCAWTAVVPPGEMSTTSRVVSKLWVGEWRL